MKQIRSQPLRCPLCERGRIIDAGPMARVSQFTLYGPQYVQHAQLIAKSNMINAGCPMQIEHSALVLLK